MTQMISICRFDPALAPADPIAHHNAKFGQYATMISAARHAEDPAQAAIVFEVHDLDGLKAASRTPEGDAYMREAGFIEQLAVFHTD